MTRKAYAPPATVEQVAARIKERGLLVDPELFVAHYEAVDWFIGRSKMKNWNAALTTWAIRGKSCNSGYHAGNTGAHVGRAEPRAWIDAPRWLQDLMACPAWKQNSVERFWIDTWRWGELADIPVERPKELEVE